MTNQTHITVTEYASAAKLNTFVKRKAATFTKIKEELNLIFAQAVHFTAAPHNDVTALNTVFTLFANASKGHSATQKAMAEFVKYWAGDYLVLDATSDTFRFKTVRVKGKSKSISEEKRTLKEGYDKMVDYRSWVHPDELAANAAANSVIDAESLNVEPVASGPDGKPDVPKEGAGRGTAARLLTKAKIETFKKSALVTLKMNAQKDADKIVQAATIDLIRFLAIEAGLIERSATVPDTVGEPEPELTTAEQAAEVMRDAEKVKKTA